MEEVVSIENVPETDLKVLVPSLFRTKDEGADERVSNKYQFMTSSEVIDLVAEKGWFVHSAKQQKTKKDPTTVKHMVRFRNQQYADMDMIPEILLVNSHNRTSSLTFHVGVFRTVCLNGLIVADDTYGRLNVRHMGHSFDEVSEVIDDIIERVPRVLDAIKDFQAIELTSRKQMEFAVKSIAIRYPEYINPKTGTIDFTAIKSAVNINQLLEPARPEDESNDLWTVFNRIQEKLVNGGFGRIGLTGKMKMTREVTNIRTNVLINKNLWGLMAEYQKR